MRWKPLAKRGNHAADFCGPPLSLDGFSVGVDAVCVRLPRFSRAADNHRVVAHGRIALLRYPALHGAAVIDHVGKYGTGDRQAIAS